MMILHKAAIAGLLWVCLLQIKYIIQGCYCGFMGNHQRTTEKKEALLKNVWIVEKTTESREAFVHPHVF